MRGEWGADSRSHTGDEGNTNIQSACLARMLWAAKERQTERNKITGCCYAADSVSFVFGAMHVIGLFSLCVVLGGGDQCGLCVWHQHLWHAHQGAWKGAHAFPFSKSLCIQVSTVLYIYEMNAVHHTGPCSSLFSTKHQSYKTAQSNLNCHRN